MWKIKNFQKFLICKDLEKDDDLKNLSNKLYSDCEKLINKISSSGCLTFGGKFEWVDSILVKVIFFCKFEPDSN